MAEPVLYDAHVVVQVNAREEGRVNVPPIVPQSIDLRRSFNLSAYPVDKFADLLDQIEECVEEWVAENPAA